MLSEFSFKSSCTYVNSKQNSHRNFYQFKIILSKRFVKESKNQSVKIQPTIHQPKPKKKRNPPCALNLRTLALKDSRRYTHTRRGPREGQQFKNRNLARIQNIEAFEEDRRTRAEPSKVYKGAAAAHIERQISLAASPFSHSIRSCLASFFLTIFLSLLLFLSFFNSPHVVAYRVTRDAFFSVERTGFSMETRTIMKR